jgi:hypothetical protein
MGESRLSSQSRRNINLPLPYSVTDYPGSAVGVVTISLGAFTGASLFLLENVKNNAQWFGKPS